MDAINAVSGEHPGRRATHAEGPCSPDLPRHASRGRSDHRAAQEDLAARAEIAFRLVVVIADDGDAIGDPTVAWPDERKRVEVGRLVLDAPETERERDGDILVFDPTRVTDGIEISDDPIPHFRPRAYSVSVARREATKSHASSM